MLGDTSFYVVALANIDGPVTDVTEDVKTRLLGQIGVIMGIEIRQLAHFRNYRIFLSDFHGFRGSLHTQGIRQPFTCLGPGIQCFARLDVPNLNLRDARGVGQLASRQPEPSPGADEPLAESR